MKMFFINTAINLVVRILGGVSTEQWEQIKTKVLELEDSILPKAEKHGKVVEFINTMVKGASSTALDFLVKCAVLFVRKYEEK